MPAPPMRWADLAFFREKWPEVQANLAAERDAWLPRPELLFAALECVAPEDVAS